MPVHTNIVMFEKYIQPHILPSRHTDRQPYMQTYVQKDTHTYTDAAEEKTYMHRKREAGRILKYLHTEKTDAQAYSQAGRQTDTCTYIHIKMTQDTTIPIQFGLTDEIYNENSVVLCKPMTSFALQMYISRVAGMNAAIQLYGIRCYEFWK